MKRHMSKMICIALVALLAPSVAFAETRTDDDVYSDGTPRSESKRDLDPAPKPPSPYVGEPGLEEQAGIGGPIAYAESGVLELGGNLGLQSNNSFTQVEASPSIGWFVADNIQVSFIPGLTYINPEGSDDLYVVDAVVEPSLHLPFNDSVFGFVGVGGGVSYAEGNGAGLALSPRLGTNIMVGRSGILTPSIDYTLSTTDAIETSDGTLLAVNNSLGVNVGYTVMW